MDDGSRLPFLFAGLLVICAMWFAVTETSISSVSRTRIKAMTERGDKRAADVMFILDNFDKAITTLLICTNIVHISTATVVTMAVTRLWGLSAVSISTVITTITVFFAGEMLPKSIAKKYCIFFSKLTSGVLRFFMVVFGPLSKLLASFANAVSGMTKGETEKSVTEDELFDIIEDMTEEGTLDEAQGDLISSALQFGDVTVESILTPRVDMAAIDISWDREQILSFIKAQNHSRLPVYRGTVDNIIGVLQIRKFIKAYIRLGDNLELEPLLDEPYFVHQSTNIDELLPIMSKHRQNLAIVTDNYGGTLGIVTVEDILEELVGEIWDEDDVVEESIVSLGDGAYSVDAEESVADVLEQIGYEDPEDDGELVNTLMGEWTYEQFTDIPHAGESFRYHRLEVTVSEVEHNRILRLRVVLLPGDEEGGEEQ